MRALDWLQAQPLQAAAVLGLLAGIGLGLAWPVTVPDPEKQRTGVWLAPARLAHARPLESEFSAVRNAPIWGDSAMGASGVKRAAWRLAGIIADPLPAALVLSDGSTDSHRVRVGGSLPDGGVIKQIMASSVSYVREGCTYERLLYGPVDPAENQACDPNAQAVK